MSNEQRMIELYSRLDGMTAREWGKLKHAIDIQFHSKAKELEPQLKLSAGEADVIIPRLFGSK
mgnify:CR=1 FL=1